VTSVQNTLNWTTAEEMTAEGETNEVETNVEEEMTEGNVLIDMAIEEEMIRVIKEKKVDPNHPLQNVRESKFFKIYHLTNCE
jgi:copper chaperone CopZ